MTVSHELQKGTLPNVSSTPLRVGMITPWNQACGLATYARFLTAQFTSHTVVVFAEHVSPLEGGDEPFVKRCWQRVGTSGAAHDYSQLESAINDARLDLLYVNCHPSFFVQPTFCSLLKRAQASGIKVLVHVHQLFTKREENIALLVVADGVIVHSPENRLEAIANGARPERVVVVPHGVQIRDGDGTESRSSLRAKLGLNPHGPLVTSFGFVQPHKGMEAVIEAVAHLRGRGIPARGLIVGESRTDQSASAQYLRALKDYVGVHKLEDFVSFESRFVTDDEVAQYLAASDLVVMNYRSDYYEASGACSLALGAGAVVMSSIAPCMNAFGDAVWHMTGGYPAGISAEILMTNPQLCEEIRQRARAYAQAHAWPVTARKIEEVCSGLFASGEERPSRRARGVQTGNTTSSSKTLRVLMQNRPGTFTHRGGDTVIVERLSQGLRERGIAVTVDVTASADPASFDLVHLFNFATPELTTHLAQRAHAAGIPFVVTTLYEELPSFHHQSHAVAIAMMEYVAHAQDRAWLAKRWIDPSAVIPAERLNVGWIVDHAASLFTNGKGETRAIVRDFPIAERIVEVPLGHEVGCLVGPEMFERAYGVRDFVLCVGRLETRKNQLMLLKALEDSDLTVVLAGGGFSYQPDYAAAVASFKRKGRTIILDRVSPEMLSSAYAACRIHVLPSWYELPGLVSLEAAAHGKNIVVTRTGTSEDYLGEKAFYCQPWDSDSINAAIMAAFYAPIKEGLVEMAKSYTWDNAVDKTVSAYEHVVKGVSDEIPQATPVGGCYDMSVDTKTVEDLIEQGEVAAREGEFDRAEDLLRQAEVADPTSSRVLKARGAVCLAQGRTAEAGGFFERALAIMPDDPNLLTGMGMCVAGQGEPSEAMAIFERVLAQQPDHLVALHQLLDCAYQVGALTRAESALRRYLAVQPQDASIRFCLGGVLYKQGMWRAAHDEISRVTQERPGDEAARELQALIEQAMVPPVAQPTSVAGPETVSNSQEVVGSSATEYFQRRDAKAAENARFAEGKMDEVEALRVQGKIEQAREILDGIRKVPDLTETQRERFTCMEAEFYALDGDIATADEMYSRVVSLNPRCVRGLCGKGALAAERQEWETAQEYFEKALAIDPTYDVALAGLGLCAMVNRKEEKAFELFMQAVASNPENRRALLGVLQLGYPMKKYAEIEKAINSYLDRHPANIEMLYSFAGILFAQGKVEQAKTEVEKILIFEPKHTNALELRDLIRGDKPASLVGA